MCASQRLVLSDNGSGNRHRADARLSMAPATSLDMNSVAPFIQLKQQCFPHLRNLRPLHLPQRLTVTNSLLQR